MDSKKAKSIPKPKEKKCKPKEKKCNSKTTSTSKPKKQEKQPTTNKKVTPKVSRKKYSSGITLIRDNDENTSIDEYYERKMNGIIKKIKDQNDFVNDKIRFGWN